MDYKIIISQDGRTAIKAHSIQEVVIRPYNENYHLIAVMERRGEQILLGSFNTKDAAKFFIKDISMFLAGECSRYEHGELYEIPNESNLYAAEKIEVKKAIPEENITIR